MTTSFVRLRVMERGYMEVKKLVPNKLSFSYKKRWVLHGNLLNPNGVLNKSNYCIPFDEIYGWKDTKEKPIDYIDKLNGPLTDPLYDTNRYLEKIKQVKEKSVYLLADGHRIDDNPDPIKQVFIQHKKEGYTQNELLVPVELEYRGFWFLNAADVACIYNKLHIPLNTITCWRSMPFDVKARNLNDGWCFPNGVL